MPRTSARACRPFDRPNEVRAALAAYAVTTDVAGHRSRRGRVAHTALIAMGPQAGTAAGGLTTGEIRAFVERCMATPIDAVEAEDNTAALLGAALRERDGNRAGAWVAATRALASAEDLDAHERAWLHLIAGRTAIHMGREADATGHAVAARRLLAAWAGPLVAAAEQLAAQCGTTRLTNRELDVLELIAAGRSNRQIAAALGIAERTVAVHVSRILAKTSSASRTEAARWHHDESGLTPGCAATSVAGEQREPATHRPRRQQAIRWQDPASAPTSQTAPNTIIEHETHP